MAAAVAEDEEATNEEEWQELPVNKLTKMLKLVRETEKKETKQEKWAKTAKDNFWRKELRKIFRILDNQAYEMRLVEGSTIYLECEEREIVFDQERYEANKFVWMRNGVVLEEESTDLSRINFTKEQKMTIYPAAPGDSGRYTCYYGTDLAGQVSLEVLPVASAVWEGFKIASIMEIIQEKEEKDLDLDDRVDQILVVLEKDNEDLKTKKRKTTPEEPEDSSKGSFRYVGRPMAGKRANADSTMQQVLRKRVNEQSGRCFGEIDKKGKSSTFNGKPSDQTGSAATACAD
ncbi:hypothetical protein M513_06025 [Trichuris suis]|uniref:Ig-like domain-containing protein n=1 Tax=Trichuris suis TaxID=68888 RepID=A0A085M7B5_9BILA|nr:hypothetical protein M513_06025 [Trichuris suis]